MVVIHKKSETIMMPANLVLPLTSSMWRQQKMPESTHSGRAVFGMYPQRQAAVVQLTHAPTTPPPLLPLVTTSADQIKAVIDNEKTLKSWTNSDKIFYFPRRIQPAKVLRWPPKSNVRIVQLNKMTEKLGGVMVFCGTPLPPIANFPTKTTAEAQAAATYLILQKKS